jgi:hypothetical protein
MLDQQVDVTILDLSTSWQVGEIDQPAIES